MMVFKAFAVLLFAVLFFTDAVEVTDEDINSPLVSYLLAKLQRLESKIMVRPNIRTTRQTTEKKTAREIDNKQQQQCNCQPGVVTYVRWGNATCPPTASILYSGVVGGSWYQHHGAATDPLCLPHDPQYLLYQAGYQNFASLYGAEYETTGPLDQSFNRNVPCAVCEVTGRTRKLMIPSHYECPTNWTREYYGYLMAGRHNHNAATKYTCMDESLAQISGSGSNTDGYLFYTVEARCSHFIPCSDKELTCVVCTK